MGKIAEYGLEKEEAVMGVIPRGQYEIDTLERQSIHGLVELSKVTQKDMNDE